MTRPLIGITLDHEAGGGYSRYPWYALRQNYVDSIAGLGGIGLGLPCEPDTVERLLEILDGVVVTGGAFDLDPALSGVTHQHEAVSLKPRRSEFELALIRGALERDLPLLGICGGMQALHVVLGGTLIQHLPDEIEGDIPHEQPNPRHEPGHGVEILAGTRLAGLAGAGWQEVNSAHHQAARDVPAQVRVNARARDGVIEGIEVPDSRFCLGVQWHPEFRIAGVDEAVLAGFVDACR